MYLKQKCTSFTTDAFLLPFYLYLLPLTITWKLILRKLLNPLCILFTWLLSVFIFWCKDMRLFWMHQIFYVPIYLIFENDMCQILWNDANMLLNSFKYRAKPCFDFESRICKLLKNRCNTTECEFLWKWNMK